MAWVRRRAVGGSEPWPTPAARVALADPPPTARLPTLSCDGAWLYFIATAEVRSSENRSF
jgi:hypothetical protein